MLSIRTHASPQTRSRLFAPVQRAQFFSPPSSYSFPLHTGAVERTARHRAMVRIIRVLKFGPYFSFENGSICNHDDGILNSVLDSMRRRVTAGVRSGSAFVRKNRERRRKKKSFSPPFFPIFCLHFLSPIQSHTKTKWQLFGLCLSCPTTTRTS